MLSGRAAFGGAGDCRSNDTHFTGVADGHFRDPLVVAEKDTPSYGSSGCSALHASGLALLMLPLLGLMKKK